MGTDNDSKEKDSNNSLIRKPSYKKIKLTPRQKQIGLVIILFIAIVAVLAATYNIGYQRGYKEGEMEGKKSSSANYLNGLFSNSMSPFRTVTGQVTSINNKEVKVDTSRGQKQTIKLTDDTKITKKTDTLKIQDVKPGQKVVIFTSGNNENDLSATRIVLSN